MKFKNRYILLAAPVIMLLALACQSTPTPWPTPPPRPTPTPTQEPELTIDPAKEYTATLRTEKGDIVIALTADKTPITVDNFVKLARDGYYNNTTFHRVLPGFMAQGGDPTGTGSGSPGYTIAGRVHRPHPRTGRHLHGQHGPAQLRWRTVLHHLCANALPEREAYGFRSGHRGHGRGRLSNAARPQPEPGLSRRYAHRSADSGTVAALSELPDEPKAQASSFLGLMNRSASRSYR